MMMMNFMYTHTKTIQEAGTNKLGRPPATIEPTARSERKEAGSHSAGERSLAALASATVHTFPCLFFRVLTHGLVQGLRTCTMPSWVIAASQNGNIHLGARVEPMTSGESPIEIGDVTALHHQ